MAFPLHLYNPQQYPALTPRRVTLARVVRAVRGFAAADAPDPDDRGFLPDAAYAKAAGPAFGISAPTGANPGPEVRLLLVRDRLSISAKLFPTVDDPSLVTITSPAAGVPLGTGGPDTITLRAAKDPGADTTTVLKIHYGSAGGPVIAEAAIRVFPVLPIPVRGFICEINGAKPACAANAQATFDALIENANKILAPAGIRLDLQAGIRDISLLGYRTANAVSGLFIVSAHPTFFREYSEMMRKNPDPAALNFYIVGEIHTVTESGGVETAETSNTLGFTVDRDFINDSDPPIPASAYPGGQVGFVLRNPDDLEKMGHTLAHELGHMLGLNHYGTTGPGLVTDMWSMRNLMYNALQLNAPDPTDKVGYGNHANGSVRCGSFLGIRSHANIAQSAQIPVLREGAAKGVFRPI